MLYNPPAFKVDSEAEIFADIERSGLAMLITNGPAGPLVSHVPLFLDRTKGDKGTLVGHLARANSHWQAADVGQEALAVFPGPDAYITPSWYPSKQEHGRVVPTWNYTVVHARRRLSFFEDVERLRAIVDILTDRFEQNRPEPWAVGDAPDRFVDMQLRAIVGLELEITSLEGKRKLSQNREAADRTGVIDGLAKEPGGDAMHNLVKSAMDD